DPAARHLILAPYGVAIAPELRRLVTTNAGHGYSATTRGERMPGIGVQVWTLGEAAAPKTALLEAGPRGEENLGPITARFFHRQPLAYVATDQGGAVYASDSTAAAQPAFRLVFDFGAGALGGGAAVTPNDRFWVEALTGLNRVASLDVSDP